jgi:hypothetical protein
MEQLRQSKLASLLTIVSGTWIVLSSTFISITGTALTSLIITGIAVIILGSTQLYWESGLPRWINAFVAMWLLLSTFTFTTSSAVVWSQTISAIIVFILAAWGDAEVSELQHIHRSNAV